MKIKLEQTTKYFTTQEAEANTLVEEAKETTNGEVVKQQIDTKKHPDYGKYYEVTIKELFTTSKSVLENGF